MMTLFLLDTASEAAGGIAWEHVITALIAMVTAGLPPWIMLARTRAELRASLREKARERKAESRKAERESSTQFAVASVEYATSRLEKTEARMFELQEELRSREVELARLRAEYRAAEQQLLAIERAEMETPRYGGRVQVRTLPTSTEPPPEEETDE